MSASLFRGLPLYRTLFTCNCIFEMWIFLCVYWYMNKLTLTDWLTLLSWLQENVYCCGGLFVFWKLHFTVQSNFKIKISSNALTKLRSENLWKLWTAIIRLMRLQVIICHKKELLSSISSIKLVLIRNKCYQRKLVCTGTINKWCKILTIKTLTEVNRT